MELTREQLAIIKSTGNIKINAVAGSGKTTTIIEYAATRPKGSRILYLAFNKSVKLEAVRMFAEKGLDNVKVETAHSLAFKHIVYNCNYTVRPQGYRTHEIAELLGLHSNGEKHTEFVIANHILRFFTFFCNSDKQRVQELNYLDVVPDSKAKAFVKSNYKQIESQTRILLGRMDTGEIDVTHDFYLKKFQLSAPMLTFDYILFDEGQDASAAMLDIFLKQKATKVIVGDTHQQIYSWRYAVNSLENTDFKTYQLSTSFRFSQEIAGVALDVLKWKDHLYAGNTFSINGKGSSKAHKVKAILARTNLGLLLKAIEYLREQRKVSQIYFEGNINSYTYADEGASLYDVLNLYNGKRGLVKDKLIGEMKDMGELREYIEKTDDAQLGMMVEIVNEYGNEIPGIIRSIKAKHVEKDDKQKAEMIFSTVHRSKGMEYDSVQLVNDFITEEKIEKLITEAKQDEFLLSKINEEINLLYVAITRTRNSLHIPEAIMPKGSARGSQIHILREEKAKAYTDNDYTKTARPSRTTQKGRPLPGEYANSVLKSREKHQQAYKPWDQKMDDELTVMYCEGVNARDMSKHFGRTRGSIRARIIKLGLEEMYG